MEGVGLEVDAPIHADRRKFDFNLIGEAEPTVVLWQELDADCCLRPASCEN